MTTYTTCKKCGGILQSPVACERCGRQDGLRSLVEGRIIRDKPLYQIVIDPPEKPPV